MTTVNWRKIAVAGAVLVAVWGIFFKLPSEFIVHMKNQNNVVTRDNNERNIIQLNNDLKEASDKSLEVTKKLTKQYTTLLITNGRYTEKTITSDLRIIDTGNYHLPVQGEKHIIASRAGTTRPNIYNFNINHKSAITAYELNSVFENCGLKGLGSSFIKAEMEYGVNAVFLASLAIHESMWGNSSLSTNKNNLFGFGAYDRDPYNMAHSFSSKEECILHVAKFLSEQYVNGGYNTGPNIINIGKKYASDQNWPFKLWNTMMYIEKTVS